MIGRMARCLSAHPVNGCPANGLQARCSQPSSGPNCREARRHCKRRQSPTSSRAAPPSMRSATRPDTRRCRQPFVTCRSGKRRDHESSPHGPGRSQARRTASTSRCARRRSHSESRSAGWQQYADKQTLLAPEHRPATSSSPPPIFTRSGDTSTHIGAGTRATYRRA